MTGFYPTAIVRVQDEEGEIVEEYSNGPGFEALPQTHYRGDTEERLQSSLRRAHCSIDN